MSHINQPRSLQQWLNQHTSANGRHDGDYDKWNVKKRPSEEARKLIRAVLVRLCKLHASGECHGALFDPENYLISRWNRRPREGEYEIQFRDPKEDNLEGSLEERQARDTSDVKKIIFGIILPDEVSSYSSDIQHLHDALAYGGLDNVVLANHPSVWGWRERMFFFSKVMTWSKFGRNRNLYQAFKLVKSDYENWRNELKIGTPLHRVSTNGSATYSNTLVDLVRFIRNVFEHITEANRSGRRKYIYDSQDSPWLQEKFVENEITKLFPLLLVKLYVSLFESTIIMLD